MKSLSAKTAKSTGDKVVLTEKAEAMFLNLAIMKAVADVEAGETAEVALKSITDHYAKLGITLSVNNFVGKPEEKTKANNGDATANIGISWTLSTFIGAQPVSFNVGTGELLRIGYMFEAVKLGTAKQTPSA